MSLQEFFQKQAMDESLAPKRGEVGREGGDSPPRDSEVEMLPFRQKEAVKGRRAARMARAKREDAGEDVTAEMNMIRARRDHRTRHPLW